MLIVHHNITQAHRGCKSRSREPYEEHGHRMGPKPHTHQFHCSSNDNVSVCSTSNSVSSDQHFSQGVIYSKTAAANYADPNMFNRSLHIIPARRLGLPEEVNKCKLMILLWKEVLFMLQVSGAVCYLLSPAASYVTGCTIPVDGGQGIYRSPWVITGATCHSSAGNNTIVNLVSFSVL